MAKVDDDFQLYSCFNCLPSESLEDYTFEVEALVAGSKDDEKKLIGPQLVRGLGGIPGALARRELHMLDVVKPVKSTSPDTENHYKNGYVNNKNFIKTNEDNNHDTKYTIHNDTNDHDARELHK